MSDWMAEYRRTQKFMTMAARLEGALQAHKMLKEGTADEYDRILWRLTDEAIAEGWGDDDA